MLEHGGRLQSAAQRYGIPAQQWVDLSTGINPQGWLHQRSLSIPDYAWTRLPEDEDDLTSAAQHYYGTAELLPVAGSQAAIQALPALRSAGRVGVLTPTYAEHAWAWRRAGHDVIELSANDIDSHVDSLDVLLLCNPNNPDGLRFTPAVLRRWRARLARHDGWLVVDEAFADCTPDISLIESAMPVGLVVLRSLGKFFGLAGARVGFVCAAPAPLQALREHLGPWSLSGPSRYIATQALRDQAWQRDVRESLRRQSRQLADLLTRHGLSPTDGCELFQWVATPQPGQIHEALAQRAILCRCFTTPAGLRFGLPADAQQWQRLEHALSALPMRSAA